MRRWLLCRLPTRYLPAFLLPWLLNPDCPGPLIDYLMPSSHSVEFRRTPPDHDEPLPGRRRYRRHSAVHPELAVDVGKVGGHGPSRFPLPLDVPGDWPQPLPWYPGEDHLPGAGSPQAVQELHGMGPLVDESIGSDEQSPGDGHAIGQRRRGHDPDLRELLAQLVDQPVAVVLPVHLDGDEGHQIGAAAKPPEVLERFVRRPCPDENLQIRLRVDEEPDPLSRNVERINEDHTEATRSAVAGGSPTLLCL